MPLEAASAAAPAAAPEAAPAAPAIPVAAKFSDVKAARREAKPGDLPVERPGTPPAPGAAKVEIDMTPEELARATQLSKAEREARAKVKELEAKAGGAAKLEEAQGLIAKGHHLKAAELLGIDLGAAVAEHLGQTPAEGEAVDPKVKELSDKLAKLEGSEAERAKRDAADLAARTAEARKTDVAAIVEHVKAQAKDFPYLSRDPAWVAEAYDGASDAYPALVKELGRELNGEEKHRLITAALQEGEAKRAAEAKKYGPVTLERPSGAVPPRPGARPTTFDSSMRGGTSAATTKPKTRLTFHEAKRARRNAT